MRVAFRYLTYIILCSALLVSCQREVDTARNNEQSECAKAFTDAVSSDTAIQQTAPARSILATVKELPNISLFATPTDSATVTLQGATLTVHIGSVDKGITLSITALEGQDLPNLPQGMVNVTANAAGFRFLPHGKHFTNRAAHISLPVDTLRIPKGYTDKDVFAYYFDEDSKRWNAMTKDTTNSDNTLVCTLTTHFTDMIAGVLQVPDMPETNGFVQTAMSDIKATDPLQGIINIQATAANQSGSATLSYPIAVPAGRNGMQPNLALTYNSESRSGWCGYGWRLQTSSIDIDTRWGVPRFDDQYETEIYLINGEQTTLQPHRSPEKIERTSDREFFPRIENSFSKIVRHGESPNNYWWELSTKNDYQQIKTKSLNN